MAANNESPFRKKCSQFFILNRTRLFENCITLQRFAIWLQDQIGKGYRIFMAYGHCIGPRFMVNSQSSKNSRTITISKIIKWENKWLFVNLWGIYANCVTTQCVRGQNENQKCVKYIRFFWAFGVFFGCQWNKSFFILFHSI